jgi:hypothetical protein
MNATTSNSVVREQPARAFGHATGAISGSTLTLDLQHVDLRLESAFTWADSGATPPDPMSFTVNAGTLGSGLGIVNGTAVEARGYFAGAVDANQDFAALSLANLETAPALMLVKDMPSGMTVTVTTSATDIQLALAGTAGAGEKAIIDRGFAGIQSLPTSPTPTIQPSSAAGLFMLRDKGLGTVTCYPTFPAFSTALGNVLTQGAILKMISAVGAYDGTTNVIVATGASAVVE